jgi:hypothetical protein
VEQLWARIPDEAVVSWLSERERLAASGYPDRPPDVDTPHLRLWVPHLADAALPYFRDRERMTARGEFPVYTATWHRPGGPVVKVLLSGLDDGSFRCRVVIEEASGQRPVDQVRVYPPEVPEEAVWAQVEMIVITMNEGPLAAAESLLVTDYGDFLALDAEIDAALADARAVGLLAEAGRVQ